MNLANRQALFPLTRAQHGNVSVWQARSRGVSDDSLLRATRSGELLRVRAGVYRSTAVASSWESELHADVLAAPSGAWASHGSALRLHGVDRRRLQLGREILIAGTGLVAVAAGTTVHRTRELDNRDRTVCEGIPTTRPGRAMVDAASTLDRWTMLEVLDDLLCGQPGLRRGVNQAATRLRAGRRNAGALADATGENAEGEFWSWLERTAAPLVGHAGITDAIWNTTVPGCPQVGIVDTYCPATGLVIEWKGLAFHRRPNALQRDSDKQNAAVTHGLTVATFTWTDVVRRASHVVEVLRQMTARAA